MILPAKKEFSKQLTSGLKTIAIRIPDNDIAITLAKEFKGYLTSTSANLSGKKPAYSAEEIIMQFKKKKYKPDLILNAGKISKVRPSTIVDFTEKPWKLIRKGPVRFKKNNLE